MRSKLDINEISAFLCEVADPSVNLSTEFSDYATDGSWFSGHIVAILKQVKMKHISKFI